MKKCYSMFVLFAGSSWVHLKNTGLFKMLSVAAPFFVATLQQTASVSECRSIRQVCYDSFPIQPYNLQSFGVVSTALNASLHTSKSRAGGTNIFGVWNSLKDGGGEINKICNIFKNFFIFFILQKHQRISARFARLYPLGPRIGGVEQTQTSNNPKLRINQKVYGLRGTQNNPALGGLRIIRPQGDLE